MDKNKLIVFLQLAFLPMVADVDFLYRRRYCYVGQTRNFMS